MFKYVVHCIYIHLPTTPVNYNTKIAVQVNITNETKNVAKSYYIFRCILDLSCYINTCTFIIKTCWLFIYYLVETQLFNFVFLNNMLALNLCLDIFQTLVNFYYCMYNLRHCLYLASTAHYFWCYIYKHFCAPLTCQLFINSYIYRL